MYTDKAEENAQEAEPAAVAQAEQPLRIYPRDVSKNGGVILLKENTLKVATCEYIKN